MPRRSRQAIGYVWFVLVAIPVLMFSAGMSVDLGRVVVANREAANMAQAAATAGALQYQNDTTYLNGPAAYRAAEQTWSMGSSAGALGLVSDASIYVSVSPYYRPRVVRVKVSYDVGGLVFLGWFENGSKTARLTITASAQVCVPGSTSSTGGYCARTPAPNGS